MENGGTSSGKLRIGIVCDAIFFDSVRPLADFVYLSPLDPDPFAKLEGLDLLLFVSTWHGLRDFDWFGIWKDGDPKKALALELIDRCRSLGIKTVFYSKEDPPNYNIFTCFASRCDYVFTSAVEKIPDYKALCGHDRVRTMTFCVNPEMHNPVLPADSSVAPDRVVFSGSWMLKYPERCRSLKAIFDGVLEAGFTLRIRDRNSRRTEKRYLFPEKFRPFVRDAVPHSELAAIHKAAAWTVNVNSVTESETMFAVRVYEMLASGIHIVSNYSLGMKRLFPMVSVAYTSGNAADILKKTPPDVLAFLKSCGIRAAISEYGNRKVFGKMLAEAGLAGFAADTATAAVVKGDSPALRAQIAKQTVKPAKIVSAESANAAGLEGCRYVAVFEDGVEYSPFYIEDCICAIGYSGADFAAAPAAAASAYRFVAPDGALPEYCVAAAAALDGAARPRGKGFALPRETLCGALYAVPGRTAGRARLSVRIDAGGGDWAGLLMATVPSLLRCETFPLLDVAVENASSGDPVAKHWFSRLSGAGIAVSGGEVPSAAPCVRLKAGDEVFASAFDGFVRRCSLPFVRSVASAELRCGRTVRIVKDALHVRTGRPGLHLRVKEPVLCRYSRTDCAEGVKFELDDREPLLARAAKCLRDNGVLFTLRRILLGKKKKKARKCSNSKVS